MDEAATARTVLGATGESVMALYAVARLLKSRDLGPAQLAPAIESSRAEALKLGPRLQQLFLLLHDSVQDSPHLQTAVRALEPCATEVAAQVAAAFDRRGLSRLGARERLLLERRSGELGAELEGIRIQLELVCAALHARPVELLLADVVDGRSGQAPTFVTAEVDLFVDLSAARDFSGDPKVLWPLFEAAMRLLAEGRNQFLLQAHTNGSGGLRVRIRPLAATDEAREGSRALKLSLGSATRVEREVVPAVARHLGIGFEVTDDEPAIIIAVG